MKKSLLALFVGSLILFSCGQQPDEFVVEGKKYTMDSLLVTSAENHSNSFQASNILLSPELSKFANVYMNILKDPQYVMMNINFDTIPGVIPIPPEYLPCLQSAPKTIRDLRDGVVVDAYEFKKGDEVKLGYLGFLNVSIEDNEKITVVEFSQFGSQICNGKRLNYGIGARLMMRIKSHTRNAKLNTPQQITASVIFGKAEVTFSMRTYGITGPGVAQLNKVGSVTEDTYKDFMSAISNLIVAVYNNDSLYIIEPQPLFLKQN